jgi:hypothetical protein
MLGKRGRYPFLGLSPFKFWTATIFLHAHLQVVYYNCVKFHKNSISSLVGVALTKYMVLSVFLQFMTSNYPFDIFVLVFIPPTNKVWGVYRNHPVRPSVRPSVRLSVRPSIHPSIHVLCKCNSTATVFLHAYLQVVYYNCVKFHKNSISSLVGVALTRYMPPPFCRYTIILIMLTRNTVIN